MPNHTSCHLRITGASTEQIERIVKAAEADRIGSEFMPMPDWQSTPNADGVLPGPEYFDRHTPWRMWQGGRLTTRGRRFPNGEYDQRWYSWCVTNWGTKWGSYDCDVSVDDQGVVTVFYNTAWSPFDDEFFEVMSAQMPEATLLNTYQESGCDFYGGQLARNGECRSLTSNISSIKTDWISQTFKPEQIAIFNNEDHEDHDEIYDQISEAWWDIEHEVVSQATVKMIRLLEVSFAPSSPVIKSSELDALISK